MNGYTGILKALKKGYHLGCWASGGGVAIASIISGSETIGGGEDGTIEEALQNANKDWLQFEKHKKSYEERYKERTSYMTGSSPQNPDGTILDRLDYWIKRDGGYMRVDFDTHSNIYIVMLDGYNQELNPIIQTGSSKDLLKAIEVAFNAPSHPKDN